MGIWEVVKSDMTSYSRKEVTFTLAAFLEAFFLSKKDTALAIM